MNTRLQHIDIAKGIGILLIVFGHNDIVAKEEGELFNIIFSFHVPVFLFLSGVFFKVNSQLRETVLSKIDSLIKPYFTTLIIWSFCQKQYSIIDYFGGILYSSGWAIPLPWIPLWFLTHLWVVMIFSGLFIKITNLNSGRIIYKVFLLLCLLLIGILIGDTFWQIPITINGHTLQLSGKPFLLNGLPFSIDVLFLSSFFFLVGFSLKKEVLNFQFQVKYFGLILVVFCYCHYQFNYTINLFERRYDHPIISTLEALCGIYIVLCVSIFMSKYKGITQVFAYIGSGSLFICNRSGGSGLERTHCLINRSGHRY